MFSHRDNLALLNSSAPLAQKLTAIQDALVRLVPPIDRIAVATYDRATDMLKTLVSSGRKGGPMYYDSRLAQSPSLGRIVELRSPRVVNDLGVFHGSKRNHTRAVENTGFRSSYTVPMYHDDAFWGFIFFNSMQPDVFTSERLDIVDVHAHLVSALVIDEERSVRLLAAAVRTAYDMVHYRDPETGAHIERMARYARLIARHLGAAGLHPIDDRMVERILEFAPLHDLGKIAVPDRILLKPGRLTREEREEMKQHTTLGLQMIETLARNFGLVHLEGLDILRHIAESHHEMLDGSGYPRGLKDGEIPIEARVVAVADIFDALTSTRRYKSAWKNEEAFSALRTLARRKLDADCVEALLAHQDEVLEIQRHFPDRPAQDAA